MPVEMNLTRIRIDRKTGEEISRMELGQREVSDKAFIDAYSKLITGMGVDALLSEIKKAEGGAA